MMARNLLLRLLLLAALPTVVDVDDDTDAPDAHAHVGVDQSTCDDAATAAMLTLTMTKKMILTAAVLMTDDPPPTGHSTCAHSLSHGRGGVRA